MKKYRSLWYMSTTNHNILYLADMQGISLLNTGNRLWKAQNSLARRGLGLSYSEPRYVQFGVCALFPALNSRVVLAGAENKAQKRCRLGVGLWRCGDSGRFQAGNESRSRSMLEMRLGWNHLLVQDADDSNSALLQTIKHDVLPLFVPVQP
jgi:hypothetical protein